MKRAIYTITLYFLSSIIGSLSGGCNFNSFYRELGCIALPRVYNTTCPEEFKCPGLKYDRNKCYYRGVSYEVGEIIPQKRIQNDCAIACRCTLDGGSPRFDCAAVDCVETFDSDKQECIASYGLGSCCSTGAVCGKDEIAALKTCEVEGKTYKEGQRFEPKDSYKDCICTATWNGSLDDPTTCSDTNCGMEIYEQRHIVEKCAPVFVAIRKICPIFYECPNAKTKIIKGLNPRGSASQCFFGNMTLNFGDEVVVEDECTKCSCEVPPFVTCMKPDYSC